jgi:hypothetical protein
MGTPTIEAWPALLAAGLGYTKDGIFHWNRKGRRYLRKHTRYATLRPAPTEPAVTGRADLPRAWS